MTFLRDLRYKAVIMRYSELCRPDGSPLAPPKRDGFWDHFFSVVRYESFVSTCERCGAPVSGRLYLGLPGLTGNNVEVIVYRLEHVDRGSNADHQPVREITS